MFSLISRWRMSWRFKVEHVIYRIKDRFRLRLGFRGLRGHEVVEGVFKILTKNTVMEILFPNTEEPEYAGVFTLIADDSDYHRIRRGFMRYKSFSIVALNSQQFAIGLGTAWGDYPADPYKNDIMILRIPQIEGSMAEICEWLKKNVPSNRGFRGSVILSMADEELGFPTAWRWLSERLADFTRVKKATDKRFIAATTLKPVVTRRAEYNRKVVSAIARLILARLNETLVDV